MVSTLTDVAFAKLVDGSLSASGSEYLNPSALIAFANRLLLGTEYFIQSMEAFDVVSQDEWVSNLEFAILGLCADEDAIATRSPTKLTTLAIELAERAISQQRNIVFKVWLDDV